MDLISLLFERECSVGVFVESIVDRSRNSAVLPFLSSPSVLAYMLETLTQSSTRYHAHLEEVETMRKELFYTSGADHLEKSRSGGSTLQIFFNTTTT